MGFRIDVSRKEAKTQRRQRKGSICVVAGSLLAGLFFWIYSLRLGVLSDSGRAILFGCLAQRSDDAKVVRVSLRGRLRRLTFELMSHAKK